MINYNNRNLWFIFFNRAGSVLFSRYVLIPATVSTILCGLMLWQPEARRYSSSSNTVAQIYSTIIGFVIIFRVNMAFGRYFEGVQHIQAMFSKWRDAFIATTVFIDTSIMKHHDNARNGLASAEAVDNVVHCLRFSKARLLHWFSLLCAVAVQSIQHGRDEEVNLHEDLSQARVFATSPFAQAAENTQGEIPAIAESFRSEDTETRRQTRTDAERWKLRDRVQVLGEITPQELEQVSYAQEAVNLVMIWILSELSDISISKQILTEPPILSRVYQELSFGTLSYFRAMQIECVPFPFPFAQVVNYSLYGFFFFCPFIVMQIIREFDSDAFIGVEHSWPALVLNFFTCAGYAAFNEIAIELEDPFGDDDNDYPVAVQQWAITWALEDGYFAPVPLDWKCLTTGSMWSLTSSPSALPSNAEMAEKAAELSTDSFQNEDYCPEASVDRGPLGAKFGQLREAVQVFAEDVARHGQELSEQRRQIQDNLVTLVDSLEDAIRSQ